MYTHVMFLYFLKTLQSFDIKFFTDVSKIAWIITYSKKLHSLKPLARGFLGACFSAFLYILRAVKPLPINVCKNGFCITQMPAALNKIFTACPLLETILGKFLVCFVPFKLKQDLLQTTLIYERKKY